MSWIAIKLLFGGFLKRLTAAFSALLGWIGRHPWQAGLIAALCLAGWQWRGKEAALDKLAAQELAHADYVRKVEAAREANAALAVAQVKAVEAKSAELAKDADHAHELALQDARTTTDRYIAANRVRPNQVCRGSTATTTEKDNPGVPADLPADPGMVAIRETELQAFTAWVAFGVAAHNGAVDELEAGTAKVPEGWPKPAF